MAKKEARTDLWVARQLDDSKIKYDPQGSTVKEINEALQSASKRGTGNTGYPEYVAVVKDFVIVIEDKADLAKHQKLTNTGILSVDPKDIADYAVNGAYFYAKHIAKNSSFHKIFAIGVSGDEKHHKITPLYVDDRDGYKQLPDLESFTSFTAVNIDEYYTRYVLAEKTDIEKTTEEILKDAAELHEYLRTYGSLKDQDKPLVVSGILLALDDKFFKPDDLLGDETTTDGQLIYDAIQRRLKASNVGPDAKRDKLMSEFSIIRTSARLNEVDTKLGKTPLKFYTEFLKKNKACGLIENENLKIIKKSSNFRSAPRIVQLLNNLRPDLPQTSAIDDFDGEVVVITCDDYIGPRRTERNLKGELPAEELKTRLSNVTKTCVQNFLNRSHR